MSKLLFFDIDGTLFDVWNGFHVTARTREALHAAHDRGYKMFVNTGRTMGSIPKEILDLPFDGFCALGQHVEVHREIVHERFIPDDVLNPLLQVMHPDLYDVLLEGPQYLYAEDTYRLPDMDMMVDLLLQQFDNLRSISEKNRTVNKVSYYAFDLNHDQKMREAYADRFDFVVYPDQGREITLPGYSKMSGIRTVMNYLGLDPTQTEIYAFGDSMNDQSMLVGADVGILMGNGDLSLASDVQYVTSSVYDDGVFQAMEHFGLV